MPLCGVGVGLYMAEVSKQRALLLPDLRDLDPYLLASYAPNQFLNTRVSSSASRLSWLSSSPPSR